MGCRLLLRPNNTLKLRLFGSYNKAYQASVVTTLALLLSIMLPFSVVATESGDNEILLVGLFVNDKETANIDALKNSNGHYLPLKIAIDQLGITPTETADEWQFHSPLGDANIDKAQIVTFQNQAFVPLDAFKPLGVNAVYNQSQLAIKMYVPWDNQKPFPKKTAGSKKKVVEVPETAKTIDYYPQTFGLGGISIDGGITRQQTDDKANNQRSTSMTRSLQMGLTGYLSGGLWGANLQYDYASYETETDSAPSDDDNELFIDNLYWTTTGEKMAGRLGTNTNSYGLGVNDYTGITVAYSNKGIKKHLAYPDSDTSQLLSGNLYGSRRNIKGSGPAGGIAELRVDGRPIARVRIALDEKYEFIGLNLANYDNDSYNVEVAIFEYSLAEPPIRIDKPNLYSRRANVATEEFLLEAGAGRQGNWFDHRDDNNESDNEVVAHTYVEYGLTNNIAVRGAVAKNADSDSGNSNEHLLGVNFGLPFNLNVDLLYERLQREKAYEAYIDYDSRYVDVNYNYRHTRYDRETNANTVKKQDEQNLNINIRPNERLSLGLHGTHKQADNQPTEQYLTASLYARLHDNLSANINKDRYNDYRYGVNWHIPQWRTHVNADWDKDSKALRISKQVTEALDVGVSATQWDESDETAYRAFLDYDYNDKHKFHVGAGHYDGNMGYDANWQYRPNDYGLISVGYRKNQSVYEQNIDSPDAILNESDYFYVQFNFDFVKTKNAGIDFGRYRPSYYGTVVTNLTVEAPNALSLDDKIQLKLDDYSVEATKVTDSQYRIENVKPGVYTLEFPMGNLPLEYQNDNLPKPTIKVSQAASTVVDYRLEKTYGVSGQLLTGEQGIAISVYQADKKVTETRTGPYGYYQLLGLSAGDYVIQVDGRANKAVTIRDTILFEVDL